MDSSASKRKRKPTAAFALAEVQQALPPVDASPAQDAVSEYSLHLGNRPLPRRRTGIRQHRLQEPIDHRMDRLEVTWCWKSGCFRFLEYHESSQRHRRSVCARRSLIYNRSVRESIYSPGRTFMSIHTYPKTAQKSATGDKNQPPLSLTPADRVLFRLFSQRR